MTTEEAKYTVVFKDGPFEIRDYASQILAEVLVGGDFEQAGNRAFSPLFNYIAGNNHANTAIAMTAPVSQTRRGQEIAMTAPVSQQPAADGWAVSFMMPHEFTMQTIPLPTDQRVTLREVPARRMAAIRFSGVWSASEHERQKTKLKQWLQTRDLEAVGEFVWARYNAPYTPWFLRRNEILIEVRPRVC